MIFTALKAILGIVVILGGWILVQQAWRRVFPGTVASGDDVLAGRIGCHQCPGACDTPCEFADSHPSQASDFSTPAIHPKGS